MSGVIDWMDAKCIKVSEKLDEFFASDEARGRLHSINVYPIITRILSVNNDFNNIKNRAFSEQEEVQFCFGRYQDIMAKINLKVVFVPSIENFCMFMGWTADMYKQMLKDSPSHIQAVMSMVEDYLIECQLSAGQRGFIANSLTKFRAQLAGEHGNNLVTQKEKNEDDRTKAKILSKAELIKGLENMGFVSKEIK